MRPRRPVGPRVGFTPAERREVAVLASVGLPASTLAVHFRVEEHVIEDIVRSYPSTPLAR